MQQLPLRLLLCSKKLLQAQRYCPGKFDDPKLWIAYPLLDWVTEVPTIRQGTAQPLLLTVRSKVSTPPGIYTVELTVTSGSGHTQAVPVILKITATPQFYRDRALCQDTLESRLGCGS